jgi:ferredoxin
VTGVEFAAVTRVFDEEGRFNPALDQSKIMTIRADAVILAIGQQSDFSFLNEDDEIEVSPAGTLKIDPETLQTTALGVYAGGDAAFGPRIAIEAVANGKQAAQSIHSYLRGVEPRSTLNVFIQTLPTERYQMPREYEKVNRLGPPTVETGRRTGITEVEKTMDEEDARRQAERCLACHVDTIYDASRCVLCNRCADVCSEKCLIFLPVEQVEIPQKQLETALEHYGLAPDQTLTVLLKDDAACIRCGLCAIRCPTDAITMERFEFVESTSWARDNTEE